MPWVYTLSDALEEEIESGGGWSKGWRQTQVAVGCRRVVLVYPTCHLSLMSDPGFNDSCTRNADSPTINASAFDRISRPCRQMLDSSASVCTVHWLHSAFVSQPWCPCGLQTGRVLCLRACRAYMWCSGGEFYRSCCWHPAVCSSQNLCPLISPAQQHQLQLLPLHQVLLLQMTLRVVCESFSDLSTSYVSAFEAHTLCLDFPDISYVIEAWLIIRRYNPGLYIRLNEEDIDACDWSGLIGSPLQRDTVYLSARFIVNARKNSLYRILGAVKSRQLVSELDRSHKRLPVVMESRQVSSKFDVIGSALTIFFSSPPPSCFYCC